MNVPTRGRRTLRGADARNATYEGIKFLADNVRVTMGPLAGYGLISMGVGRSPKLVNDGVTMARDSSHPDEMIDQGCQMARAAAKAANMDGGDGTTTCIVIMEEAAKHAVEARNAGAHGVHIHRQMLDAKTRIAQVIESLMVPVDSPEMIHHVALTSSRDEQVATCIADAYRAVGLNGTITAMPSEGTSLELDVSGGITIDRGIDVETRNNALINHPDGSIVLENALVLVTLEALRSVEQLMPALDAATIADRPLFIIAPAIEHAVVGKIAELSNNARQLVAAHIKAPAFANQQVLEMQDLALITGATLTAPSSGVRVKDVTIDQLGSVGKVTIKGEQTTLVGLGGDESQCEQLAAVIGAELQNEMRPIERQKYERRIARLQGKAAVIRVGAETEQEFNRLKELVEDAMQAARAAIRGGIVPGGGAALLHAGRVLAQELGEDATLPGYAAALEACKAPARQILTNSGHDDRTDEFDDVVGVNSATGGLVALVEAGIVDPLPVTLSSLSAGLGTAAGCALIEVSITEVSLYQETDGLKQELDKL